MDSKAEKETRTATLQMSQTSLRIRQIRQGIMVDDAGMLPIVSVYGGKQYLTTTAFLHFGYEDRDEKHHLLQATICCLPNGRLQQHYNPNAEDTIWLAGRNAPSLKEDFRVRVSYAKLRAKAAWRVQNISYDESAPRCTGQWKE